MVEAEYTHLQLANFSLGHVALKVKLEIWGVPLWHTHVILADPQDVDNVFWRQAAMSEMRGNLFVGAVSQLPLNESQEDRLLTAFSSTPIGLLDHLLKCNGGQIV